MRIRATFSFSWKCRNNLHWSDARVLHCCVTPGVGQTPQLQLMTHAILQPCCSESFHRFVSSGSPGACVAHSLVSSFWYGGLLGGGSALECTLGPAQADISLFQQVLRIVFSRAAEGSTHWRLAEGWHEGLSCSLCLWQSTHTKPGRLQSTESALAPRMLCVKIDFDRVNINHHKPTTSSSHNPVWKCGLK